MWIKGIILILSYLLGCFNTGYYYIQLAYKQDVRTVGTNVTGAYNVSRIGGKKGFIITFLGDALKGAIPVVLCRLLYLDDTIIMLSILAVLLGHIFPFQLNFKGGKGLSTAVGAFFAFQPLWVLYWIMLCIVLLPIIRRYTITCLFALVLLPVALFIGDYTLQMILFIVLYAIIIFIACRDNLMDYLKVRAYQGMKNKDEEQ